MPISAYKEFTLKEWHFSFIRKDFETLPHIAYAIYRIHNAAKSGSEKRDTKLNEKESMV